MCACTVFCVEHWQSQTVQKIAGKQSGLRHDRKLDISEFDITSVDCM